jgi:hypothetical protein
MGKDEVHIRDNRLQFMNYERKHFVLLAKSVFVLFTGWMGTTATKQGLGTSTVDIGNSSFRGL